MHCDLAVQKHCTIHVHIIHSDPTVQKHRTTHIYTTYTIHMVLLFMSISSLTRTHSGAAVHRIVLDNMHHNRHMHVLLPAATHSQLLRSPRPRPGTTFSAEGCAETTTRQRNVRRDSATVRTLLMSTCIIHSDPTVQNMYILQNMFSVKVMRTQTHRTHTRTHTLGQHMCTLLCTTIDAFMSLLPATHPQLLQSHHAGSRSW